LPSSATSPAGSSARGTCYRHPTASRWRCASCSRSRASVRRCSRSCSWGTWSRRARRRSASASPGSTRGYLPTTWWWRALRRKRSISRWRRCSSPV